MLGLLEHDALEVLHPTQSFENNSWSINWFSVKTFARLLHEWGDGSMGTNSIPGPLRKSRGAVSEEVPYGRLLTRMSVPEQLA